jgi:hypothetical protein
MEKIKVKEILDNLKKITDHVFEHDYSNNFSIELVDETVARSILNKLNNHFDTEYEGRESCSRDFIVNIREVLCDELTWIQIKV